jgi:CheY-like chemotaxis protein
MKEGGSSLAMTGIVGLDNILRGGLPRGRFFLVEGDPGVGKTTLALQFLMEGARLGERVLYVTLSETKEELEAVAASHDWSLEGIDVYELASPESLAGEDHNTLFHPSEVELAETMKGVFDLCQRIAPQRVVLDSLSEIRLLARVTDTGTGISPEILPTIFEPFTQSARTLDRAQGGMGLGLSVVRTLVRLHGGSVTATSAGLGHGAELTVRLPLAPAAASERQDVTAATAELGPRRVVLVVEDGPDNRETLQELLELLGHEVHTAVDGVEGVERALALRPDVALVDIGLPRLDGFEVARRLRAELGAGVFLVALTGYGQPEDRARALAAGFDMHLTKPMDLDALERTLTALPPRAARGPGYSPAIDTRSAT